MKWFYSANRIIYLFFCSSWKCSHVRSIIFIYYSARIFRIFWKIFHKRNFTVSESTENEFEVFQRKFVKNFQF